MTVESNDVIAIATLSDWLKKTRACFSTNDTQNQPMIRKTKSKRTMYARFFPRYGQVTRNS